LKTIAIVRHAKKKGEVIDDAALAEIEKNGIPGLNQLVKGEKVSLHLGSEFVRTEQTILAFGKYAERVSLYDFKGYVTLDKRFGNPTMFVEFFSVPAVTQSFEADGKTWFEACTLHNPDFLARTQTDLVKAVKNAFFQIGPDETLVTIGHTPLIEWLVFALDGGRTDRNLRLNELTGFILVEDCGKIEVTGVIGF
jgi:phosphohistidine phosphatase SixA